MSTSTQMAVMPAQSQFQIADKLESFGWRLKNLAYGQIAKRQMIEDRWLADLEQQMGRYDRETLDKLAKAGGSQAFVNVTAELLAKQEARIVDILFPTDDENWGIQPTPVPKLMKMANSDDVAGMDDQGQPIKAADMATEAMEEATEASKAMSKEIDDQFTECHYPKTARMMIHDTLLFGSGVLKAPVVVENKKKKWAKLSGAVYEIKIETELKPAVERVKIWDWFPDMSAQNLDDCEFIFERRYVTKSQLIALSKRPGYMADQLRKVIKQSPGTTHATNGQYVARLRELSGVQSNLTDNRYELWEYHGPVSAEELRSAGVQVEDDPLEQHEVVVTFINDVVVKADVNPSETGERPYSLFTYQPDDSSIFGFGIPFITRQYQRIVNAAWRMVLDNAALSTGGQVIVNRELVMPSDGAWDLKAKKIWWLLDVEKSVRDVFALFEIPSHQKELMEIFERALQMAKDVIGLNDLSSGNTSDQDPETALATSMLLNAALATVRTIVKSFDDNVTKPIVTRFYDYNMQNSKDESIKGDFQIDARGSSTLLVKESQAIALQGLMKISEVEPYASMTKHAELYRKTVQSQHISPDDIVKSDAELKSDQATQTPAQKMQEAELQELLKKIALIDAQIEQTKSATTGSRIKSQYEATETAIQIAVNPAIVPIADSLLESAGEPDENGAPMAVAPQAPMPGVVNTDPNPHTHPSEVQPPAQIGSPATGGLSGFNGGQ